MFEKYAPDAPANRVRITRNFVLSHPAHWIATFFGVGALRPAPGTWGTLAGVLVYGHPQLMVTEHCLLTAEGPCAHSCSACARRKKERYLVEASGARLPVHIDVHGRTRTFDVCVLDRIENVSELMEAGVSDIAIDATLLDASELECAICAVMARAASSEA